MRLAKTLLAALAALALAACGGEPGPLSGSARPQGLVAEVQPAGGRTDTLSGAAEVRPAALSGVAEVRPAAQPQGLVGRARPVVSGNP